MFTCSALLGGILGLRLQVLVLCPAIFGTAGTVVGWSIREDAGLWSTLLAIVAATTGLQVGYLAGAMIGTVVVRHRDPAGGPSSAVSVPMLRDQLER
jgi:hypothetical protein